MSQKSLCQHGFYYEYIDGLVQDCSNFTANALELLQSCSEPLISRQLIWRVFLN